MKYQSFINSFGDYDFRYINKNLNASFKQSYISADIVGVEEAFKNTITVKSKEFEGDIYGGNQNDKITLKANYYYGGVSTQEGNDKISLNLGIESEAYYKPGTGSNMVKLKSYGAISHGLFESNSENTLKASAKFSDMYFLLEDSQNSFNVSMKGSYFSTEMNGNGNNTFNLNMKNASYEGENYHSIAEIETGSGHQKVLVKLKQSLLTFDTVIPSGEGIDSSYNFNIKANNLSEIYIQNLHEVDIYAQFKLSQSLASIKASAGEHQISAKLKKSSSFLFEQEQGNEGESSNISLNLKQESWAEYINETDSQTLAQVKIDSSGALLVTGSADDAIYLKSKSSEVLLLMGDGNDSLHLSGSVKLTAGGEAGDDTLYLNGNTTFHEDSVINSFETIELNKAKIKVTENLFFNESDYDEAFVQGKGKIIFEDGENWYNQGHNESGHLVYTNSKGFSLIIDDEKIAVKEIEPKISNSPSSNGSIFESNDSITLSNSPLDDQIILDSSNNNDVLILDSLTISTVIQTPPSILNLGIGDEGLEMTIGLNELINIDTSRILGDVNDTVILDDEGLVGEFIDTGSNELDGTHYTTYSHSQLSDVLIYIQDGIEVLY